MSKGNKDEVVKLRLGCEEKKFLSAHAKKNHRTFAATCRLGLEEWIDHLKRKEVKKQ